MAPNADESRIIFLKEHLVAFIRGIVGASAPGVDALVDSAQFRQMKRKEHLVSAGEVSPCIAFFVEGYFRFYHYLPNGTEITSDFYFAPNVATSYTSFIKREPSEVYVQAMDEMDVLTLDHSTITEFYTKYPSIERLGRLLAENVAITSEKHLFSLLNYNAEERYHHLMETHPEFIQQIPVQYIASYLGITPETLSRIRQRIR